jgi:putative FmdB family regulatory protein
MPIYEYKCALCGEVQEVLVRGEEKVPLCCTWPMVRKISLGSFRLKGEGWEKDGYGGKNE